MMDRQYPMISNKKKRCKMLYYQLVSLQMFPLKMFKQFFLQMFKASDPLLYSYDGHVMKLLFQNPDVMIYSI